MELDNEIDSRNQLLRGYNLSKDSSSLMVMGAINWSPESIMEEGPVET